MFETTNLLWGVLFSSIGLGYFIFGKKQKHKVAFYTGISLMIFPYFITDQVILVITGIGLISLPYLIKKLL